jgi:hypothetical protein
MPPLGRGGQDVPSPCALNLVASRMPAPQAVEGEEKIAYHHLTRSRLLPVEPDNPFSRRYMVATTGSCRTIGWTCRYSDSSGSRLSLDLAGNRACRQVSSAVVNHPLRERRLYFRKVSARPNLTPHGASDPTGWGPIPADADYGGPSSLTFAMTSSISLAAPALPGSSIGGCCSARYSSCASRSARPMVRRVRRWITSNS